MVQPWTAQKVLELAPDAGSAKSGQGLAKPAKWKTLGRSDRALWGLLQGSGKDPYQVRVDLSGPAFKCSCPSRKFPCKHGLGLLLIYADRPESLKEAAEPDWVADWLSGRAAAAQKKAEKAEAKRDEPVDPAAQARRAAQREARVRAGQDELSLWLADLVRQGLAAAQGQASSYFGNLAARLVDAQAPGLSRLVRELGETASGGPDWQQRLLAGIGRLHLLVEGYRRLPDLPPDTQADLRTAIGWTIREEDLPDQPAVADQWLVAGQRVEQEEQLRVQRTWLWGVRTARPALVLSFAAGTQSLDASFVTGTAFEGDLVYYPSASPLRAIVRDRHGAPAAITCLPGAADVPAALSAYTQALSRCPWLERFPLALSAATPEVEEAGEAERWFVADAQGARLPVAPQFVLGWHLRAVSGGAPLGVFGEWDGQALYALSAWSGDRFFTAAKVAETACLARVT